MTGLALPVIEPAGETPEQVAALGREVRELARRRNAAKRGGGLEHVTLGEGDAALDIGIAIVNDICRIPTDAVARPIPELATLSGREADEPRFGERLQGGVHGWRLVNTYVSVN